MTKRAKRRERYRFRKTIKLTYWNASRQAKDSRKITGDVIGDFLIEPYFETYVLHHIPSGLIIMNPLVLEELAEKYNYPSSLKKAARAMAMEFLGHPSELPMSWEETTEPYPNPQWQKWRGFVHKVITKGGKR